MHYIQETYALTLKKGRDIRQLYPKLTKATYIFGAVMVIPASIHSYPDNSSTHKERGSVAKYPSPSYHAAIRVVKHS